jgi:hypothetical protein
VRLLEAALRDLQSRIPSLEREASVGFYLSLPDPERRLTGEALIPNPEGREGFRTDAEAARTGTDVARYGGRILEKATRLSGWPGRWSLSCATTSGATGVFEAGLRALSDLTGGAASLAVVGGVDTYVGEETLVWLEATGRLKTPDMPAGLQPGESAALFVLQPEKDARIAGRAPLCFVEEVRASEEPHGLLTGLSPTGEGTAAVLGGLSSNPKFAPAHPWVILDSSGEQYRAQEWGNALVRIVADHPEFQEVEDWYPAVSFGDTGAASGAVAVCVAAAAFARGYAPAESAYLVSTGDGSSRVGVALSGPEGPRP